MNPVFYAPTKYPNRIALQDNYGEYSYKNLFSSSVILADAIKKILGEKQNERIAFLCPNDCRHVITLWGSWLAGQIGNNYRQKTSFDAIML